MSYLHIVTQTGSNTNSPQAALDVSYTNAGIILPNSTLANLNTQTITNPQGGNFSRRYLNLQYPCYKHKVFIIGKTGCGIKLTKRIRKYLYQINQQQTIQVIVSIN